MVKMVMIKQKNENIYYSDSEFTKNDKKEISKLIAYEIINSEKDFVWQINDKGLLVLKNEKNQIEISNEEKNILKK